MANGPSEVRIKILWDSVAANRAMLETARTNAQAQKQIAVDARVSAQATLAQARAVEVLEKASLSVSRAQVTAAQASAAQAKASRITTDSLVAEARASDRAAEAATRRTAATRAAADRRLVFADTRMNRDMSWAARDAEDVRGRRTEAVSSVSGGAMLGGAAVLGGLAYAGDQAMKFDAMLVKMRNNTQMTDSEFQAFKAHIIQMGTSTGASMEQMAGAFMRAKNHGLDMATSMQVVDAATKSALATGSDIEQTTNVLAQTMHIFHLNANQSTQAMDTLHQASLQGNTTMEELVQHFGLAEAVTSKYGLTLADTSAAFATMTENGMDASQAGVQVRDVMSHLTAAGPAATKEILRLSKATGVDLVGDIEKLKRGQGSLTQTMIDLNAATGGQAVEINKIIPAQRGAFGAMALSGKAADDLRTNYKQLVATMDGKLHPTAEGFARQQETLAAKTARLNNEFQVMYVKLGTSVTPVLESVVTSVSHLLDQFNSLSPATQRTIVETLGWFGTLLLIGGTIGKVATGIIALTNSLRLMGIGVAAVETAEVSAGAAGTSMAAAGLAAFGPGAALAVAIGALGVEIIALKNDWDDVKKAQDQAADSAKTYADKLKTLKAGTSRDALIATKQDLGRESGDLTTAIRMAGLVKAQPGQNAQDLATSRDADLRSQLKEAGYDITNANYGSIAGAQSRLNALMPDLAKVTAALHAQTPAVNAANRMADTHADQLAPYQVPLLKAVGDFHNASVQCGEFIRKGASAFGMVGSIQSAANAALKGKNVVGSDGVDVHGAPRYPNGTVIYFGHQGAQHFVSTYVNDRGEQKVVENTEAGQGRGTWRVRADRDLKAISDEYHGHQVAFSLPGVAGPAGAATGSGGSGINHIPKGGADETRAKDKAAALMERAGMATDQAKRNFQDAEKAWNETHNLHYLSAAENLRRVQTQREIAEAKDAEAKDNTGKDADTATNALKFERKRKDLLASQKKDLDALTEKANGTPDERRKAAADLATALLERRLQSAGQAITRLETLAETSTDPKTANALENAYRAQAAAQTTLLRSGLSGKLDEIPNTPGRQSERRALVVAEQNQELQTQAALAEHLAALDEKRAQLAARAVDVLKEQAAGQSEIAGAQMADAQTDDTRLVARQKVHALKLDDLDLDRQAARAEVRAKYDPLLDRAPSQFQRAQIQAQKDAALGQVTGRYNASVTAENIGFGTGEREAANQSIQTRAERLRTEAGLTDDLTAKMAKLAQAYDLLIGIEPDPAAAALLARQKQDEQDKLGLRRDTESAQRSLSGGILSGDPQAITGALNALQALAVDSRANREEQQSGRGAYAGAIKDLTEQLRLSPHEAVSRLMDQRPNMTPAEIAAATGEAKNILDGLLERDFAAIDKMHSPRDRKRALDTLRTTVASDPAYQAAGLVPGADKKITDKLGQSLRHSGIVDEFFHEMTDGAGRAGSQVVQALLHPKDKKNIAKAFWADITQAAEGALGNVVQKEITHGLDALLGAGLDALSGLGGKGKGKKTWPASVAGQVLGSVAGQIPGAADAASGVIAAVPNASSGGLLGTITGIAGALGGLNGIGGLSGKAKAGAAGGQMVSRMQVGQMQVGQVLGGKGGVGGAQSQGGGIMNDIGGALGIASILAGPLFGAGAAAAVTSASGIFGGIAGALGSIFHFADGGSVPGPKGAGDIVPALLSPGEFVLSRGMVANMAGGAYAGPSVRPAIAGWDATGQAVSTVEGLRNGQSQTQSPSVIHYEQHNHNPVFHDSVDLDRENRRHAQRLTKSFTLG